MPPNEELRRRAQSFAFDRAQLRDVATSLAEEYQHAQPFPHFVIDDLIPDEVLDAVVAEFPAPDAVSWWAFDSPTERKLASHDDSIMGPNTRHLLAQLNSSTFVAFLEALTGIPGLIPDPHYFGGGLHQIERGGFLEIHADFDRHPTLNLDRRLNLLIYLNHDWDESYGGHLELWRRDMSACAIRVLPQFGRVVVFNTTDHSFHGHPEPLTCPPDTTRKSIALYYYTAHERPESAPTHNTLFQSRPSHDRGWRSVAKKVLPTAVVDAARRRRDRNVSPPDGAEKEHTAQPDPADVDAMFSWFRAQGATRPQYLWPVLQAARSAANLGIDRMSVIEFGVAGGNGLIALEQAAAAAESMLPLEIDVFGFDTGTGMPEPKDHRDIPWAIEPGYFPMDVDALQARLQRAQLVLGPIGETVSTWLESPHAPIGFISFDVDYYSSTVDAFATLHASTNRLLPRILCYFDDVLGYGWSDFNGERAAITDFNEANEQRKIGIVHGLRYVLPPSELHTAWPEKIFVMHAFDHELYNTSEGPPAAHWFESLRLAPEQ